MTDWPAVATSGALKDKLKTAKILAVGAGGIGCELLKSLALTGFEDIEVIDMDTIEISNLNRQFLFRKRHVGESKAKVAAEAVQRFRPQTKIKAHQANIKEAQYGVDFFRKFDLVLNGLDNLEARRHVNRLCLAAGTPLVESGTAGYLGQVNVHLRIRNGKDEVVHSSECFECQPKAAPKSYPVCTIRNTPDKPIHCVVWAKDLLFQRVFGSEKRSPETVTDLDEATVEEAEAEAQGAERDNPSDFVRGEGESAADYAARIFQRVFCRDIERVVTMEELWKTREKPKPLNLSAILPEHAAHTDSVANGNGSSRIAASKVLGLKDQHTAWTLKENAQVFLTSMRLFLETRPEDVGAAVFDKDDDLAVEFVTAASNLRSLCYNIPTQSLFAAKGMAGNIIHAIATTNATIAGMIVVEAMKLLAGMPQTCKMSYLQQLPSGKRLITAMELSEPNPKCVVCGTAQLRLSIHTGTTTLATLVDKVLKKRLAMNEPSIMCGGFAYEEGADLEEDEVADNARLLPLPLDKLPGGGVIHGSILAVSDQAQDFSVQILVQHKEDWDEEKEPDGFELTGSVPDAKADDPNVAGPSGTAADDDDDVELVEDSIPTSDGKRKRGAEEEAEDNEDTAKRLKGVGIGSADDPIDLD